MKTDKLYIKSVLTYYLITNKIFKFLKNKSIMMIDNNTKKISQFLCDNKKTIDQEFGPEILRKFSKNFSNKLFYQTEDGKFGIMDKFSKRMNNIYQLSKSKKYKIKEQ